METGLLNISVSPEKAFLLSEIGRAKQCSPQEVLNTMLDEYIAAEQHFDAGVRAALAKIAAGKTIPAEIVFSEFLSDPA